MKAKPPTAPSERLRLIASSLLEKGGVLDGEWFLSEPLKRIEAGVELFFSRPGDAQSIAIQWQANRNDVPARAFKVGPSFNASYRCGPGHWDIDGAETPEGIKERAYLACELLASHEDEPSLWLARTAAHGALPADRLDHPLPADPIDALTVLLRHRLTRDLGTPLFPNPEGWRLKEVRSFLRQQRVSEMIFEVDDKSLAFIIRPTDDSQAAFCRIEQLDLVYYSDDLEPSDHDALYARDREMIERVCQWFRLWDGGVG